MPIVPPGSPSSIFYNTTDILNMARVLVNDAQGGLSGQDLADARPQTWVTLNIAYDALQSWLEDNNVESAMYAEAIVSLPVNAGSQDPNAQTRLGYDGFVDAAGNFYDQPNLPQDMLEPLQLESRTTGLNQPFYEMKQKLGGMGAQYGNGPYLQWEFRQNSIYILGGSVNLADIRIRYIPSMPQLIQPTLENPNPPVIYFANAGLALARMVAAEFQEIRNAVNAPTMRAKANAELAILANKSAKRENQSQQRKRGYGFGGRRGGSRGYTVVG